MAMSNVKQAWLAVIALWLVHKGFVMVIFPIGQGFQAMTSHLNNQTHRHNSTYTQGLMEKGTS